MVTSVGAARLVRIWDAMERCGMLHQAVVNGADRVRVQWLEPQSDAFSVATVSRPSLVALAEEYAAAAREDVIDVGEVRYRIVAVRPDGSGRLELQVEKQTS